MMRIHAQSIPAFSPMAPKRAQAKGPAHQVAQTMPAPTFSGLTKHIQGRHWLNPQTVHTLTFPTAEKPEPTIKTGNIGHIPKAFLQAAGCTPQEIYTGLSELANCLRPLRHTYPFPDMQFKLGHSNTPIQCKSLDSGNLGSIYLLTVNEASFVFKVFHKLQPEKPRANESHGPIAENVSGCFLAGFPLSYVARFQMGNVHHGWSVLEFIDRKKDYSHRSSSQSQKRLPLRHTDLNGGSHVQNIIVDIGGAELSLPMDNLAEFKAAMRNPKTRDLAIKSFSSLPTPEREPSLIWATDQGLVNGELAKNLDLFNMDAHTQKRRIVKYMLQDPNNLPHVAPHLYCLADEDKLAAMKAILQNPACHHQLPYEFEKSFIPAKEALQFFQDMIEVETLQEKAFRLIPRMTEAQEQVALSGIFKTPALQPLAIQNLGYFRPAAQDKLVQTLWQDPALRVELAARLPKWRDLDEVSRPYIDEALQQKDLTLALARGIKQRPAMLQQIGPSLMAYPETLADLLPLALHLHSQKILQQGLKANQTVQGASVLAEGMLPLALGTVQGRKEVLLKVWSIEKTKLPAIFDTLLSHPDSVELAPECLRYMEPGKIADDAYDRAWTHEKARAKATTMISHLTREKQLSAVLAALECEASRTTAVQTMSTLPFPIVNQAAEAAIKYPDQIPALLSQKLLPNEKLATWMRSQETFANEEYRQILVSCLAKTTHKGDVYAGMQSYVHLLQRMGAFQVLRGIELQDSQKAS